MKTNDEAVVPMALAHHVQGRVMPRADRNQAFSSLCNDSTPAPVMVETASGLVPLTGVKSINRSDGLDQCVTMRVASDFGSLMGWGGDDGRPGVLGNGAEPVSSMARPSQWEGTPVI